MNEKTISNKKKILIGGLGGITPVLMNLLVIDLEMLLLNFTIVAIIGYLIRVVILFYLGGIVAFLNKSEVEPVRIFQLGIVAPAMVTAAINGSHIEVQKPVLMNMNPEKEISIRLDEPPFFSLTACAYAQSDAQAEEDLKIFAPPRETAMQQFFRGFFGKPPRNIWFVIAGSHKKVEDAKKHAQEIRKKGFTPAVYRPGPGSEYYSVVIGARLEYDEAITLKEQALKKGLPKDTYLWTFPKTD